MNIDKLIAEKTEYFTGNGDYCFGYISPEDCKKIIEEVLEDKLQKEQEEKLISSDWLKEIHPELNLTTEEAEDLKQFCKEHTIEYKKCYGEGQIMLPKWKEDGKNK